VGVSTFCDWPPEATRLPKIGSYLAPNVEAVVALAPDVVIGVPSPGNRPGVEALRRLGVPVVMVGETTLADAFGAIRTVGAWVGNTGAADRLVADVERELEEVRRRAQRLPRVRVLFVVGHDPLVAAGGGLFIDELLEIVGGENVAADLPQRWPRLSLETAVAGAPEVIIDGAMGSEAGDALMAYWKPYRSIPAVREGRVRAQRSDALLRPGPRAGIAARELEALLRGSDAASAEATR
jgi:cobalamin transport system substrate-binding protein